MLQGRGLEMLHAAVSRQLYRQHRPDAPGADGRHMEDQGIFRLRPDGTGKAAAHPAKFLETVESIIGESVEIPAKLQEFMKGEKKSLQMTKEFADFKNYLLSL